MYGTIASLAVPVLDTLSTLLSSATAERFTLADGLTLAVLLPEALVLWVFVRIAGTLGGDRMASLKRSSICTYLVGWLLAAVWVLAYLAPNLVEADWVYLLGAVGLGVALIGLFCYAFRSRNPIPFVILGYFVVVHVPRWLGWPLNPVLGIGLFVLVLLLASLVGYPIWFGISLIRGRKVLGPAATVLGVLEIVGAAAPVGLALWFGYAFANAPPGVLEDQQAFDRLWTEQWERFKYVGIGASLAYGLGTAALFEGLRRRLTERARSLP